MAEKVTASLFADGSLNFTVVAPASFSGRKAGVGEST
jgi:hypothetical protein